MQALVPRSLRQTSRKLADPSFTVLNTLNQSLHQSKQIRLYFSSLTRHQAYSVDESIDRRSENSFGVLFMQEWLQRRKCQNNDDDDN